MVIETGNSGEAGWSIGELSRATGLSVRVLRHWDEIGLVSPGRTSAGHRSYRRADVGRLYRAMTLRHMGLGLDQVAALLAEADPAPRATLRAHLERVEADLAARHVLRDRLVAVLHALDASASGPEDTGHTDDPRDADREVDVALLMKVIEKMTMFEQHLSSEQRTWFARRREQVGEQAWGEALEAWPELIRAVRAEMYAGTDPAAPQVQELMVRWDELRRVFLDDDADVQVAAGQAWQAMWDQHPDQLRQSPRVAPPEMWHYLQRAQDAARPTD